MEQSDGMKKHTRPSALEHDHDFGAWDAELQTYLQDFLQQTWLSGGGEMRTTTPPPPPHPPTPHFLSNRQLARFLCVMRPPWTR